jgi:hypothetical protein
MRVQLHEPAVANVEPRLEPGQAWLDRKGNRILAVCRDGSVLAVPKLKRENRVLVTARDFWAGFPKIRDPQRDTAYMQFISPPVGSS